MDSRRERGPGVTDRVGSAERRRRHESIIWTGVLISVGVHALALLFWPMVEISYEPRSGADGMMSTAIPIVALRPLEEEVIRRPAVSPPGAAAPARRPVPRLAAPPELTLDSINFPQFDELPGLKETLPPLPPPPVAAAPAAPIADEWSTYEPVTAATVKPDIRNRSEVRRFLERRYQPILSATGATGDTLLRFWIDEKGVAQRVLMVASSGHDRLDELAMSAAEVIRFRPAIHDGKPVRVVVDVPIRFEARMGL